MKRVLVVDDEQHVVDLIVRIIQRELSSEFQVVGTASSGRDTLDKAPDLLPDIIVLDVRMPGISGLDTVRELKKRGSRASFVLSTAYERFDIAREALELGITGYILKPVTKEALVQGLRTAAEALDGRDERGTPAAGGQNQAILHLAREALMTGLMLGRGDDPGAQELRKTLGLEKPQVLVAAAVFLHHPKEGKAELESLLQYKSQALCGPLIHDRCLILLPLGTTDEKSDSVRQFRESLEHGFAEPLKRGSLRLGFARPCAWESAGLAWTEALARSTGRSVDDEQPLTNDIRFAIDHDGFWSAIQRGDAESVRSSFDALLAPFEGLPSVGTADRYRLISLLGLALMQLSSKGHLDAKLAQLALDFDDLRSANTGHEFCLMARSRLPAITAALSLGQRWSPPLSAAVEFIRTHFHLPLTLDSVAEQQGLTPKRLSRYFIEEIGQGFSDYLIDFRIDQAKILLALPGASIKQVSQDCGYPDPNYFARLFKKVTGSTPSEFASIP